MLAGFSLQVAKTQKYTMHNAQVHIRAAGGLLTGQLIYHNNPLFIFPLFKIYPYIFVFLLA